MRIGASAVVVLSSVNSFSAPRIRPLCRLNIERSSALKFQKFACAYNASCYRRVVQDGGRNDA
jgi:hypothetical protein